MGVFTGPVQRGEVKEEDNGIETKDKKRNEEFKFLPESFSTQKFTGITFTAARTATIVTPLNYCYSTGIITSHACSNTFSYFPDF